MKVGFSIDAATFKASFFDFEKVLNKAEAAHRRGLARFGGAVRIRARRSIRRRKKSSKPGQAPSDHSRLLKENIYFADDTRAGVIIGPAAIKSEDGPAIVTHQRATETLEYGGTIGVREVWIGGSWKRYGITAATRRKGLKTRVRRVKIRARPYMGPAFHQVVPTANRFWRDSIKR